MPPPRLDGAPPHESLALPIALATFAFAASLALPFDPRFALFAAPFAFALADAGAALLARLGRPRVPIVVFARFVAAAVNFIALQVVLTFAIDPGAPLARWVLPATAVLVAVGWVFGALGGSLPSANVADGALVALGDAAVTLLAFLFASVPVGTPLRARLLGAFAVAGTFLARAFLVATILSLARARRRSPLRAAVAFVIWLALASLLVTIAANVIAWCGLGAAILITFASILAESRRARPDATTPLGRSAVGFLAAAVLAILVVVARA